MKKSKATLVSTCRHIRFAQGQVLSRGREVKAVTPVVRVDYRWRPLRIGKRLPTKCLEVAVSRRLNPNLYVQTCLMHCLQPDFAERADIQVSGLDHNL